jgi:hypothetical protein
LPGRPGLAEPDAALCPEPSPPSATYPGHPRGAGYGIPFVAAIGNVVLLAGYNAAQADHPGPQYQDHRDTWVNEPWGLAVYNVTGWVDGLLDLPSLAASDTSVVYCTPRYGPGPDQCPSLQSSTGCVWLDVIQQGLPWTASLFSGDCTKTGRTPPGDRGGSCLPFVVTLSTRQPRSNTPVPAPRMRVIGVSPQGQLELTATTYAYEVAVNYPGTPSAPLQTCISGQPAALSLSTQAPPAGVVPPTGPPTPPPKQFQGATNPDDRPLLWPPSPLSGSLDHATATLSSNDFSVPAFLPPTQDPNQDPSCSTAWLDTDILAAGILNNGSYNYQLNCGPPTDPPCAPIVDPPGWAQATGTATIVDIGLPKGPPPGFRF